jgi:DNA-binding MarR family transcriptional regulator
MKTKTFADYHLFLLNKRILTNRQALIMLTLARTGPLEFRHVAMACRLLKLAVNRATDWLEGEGLVKRERRDDDNRKVMVRLTPVGTKVVKEAGFVVGPRRKSIDEIEESNV